MSPRPSTLLRPELSRIVEGLLSQKKSGVSLDDLGEAIGALAISTDEIDAMVTALEGAGRSVGAEDGVVTRRGKNDEKAPGEKFLLEVLTAARVLRHGLGRSASPAEIAARSGLTLNDVHHALALARVMQR